ncbi:MAG: GNAT family N-acetyltransferase [Candidatus Peribacteraceae bacterium]|nr:GNAT family N-acetyltransferase [Candidatus Peribacteraceae bacterium]MDD5739893.1 GNAT family N-acetyltransferase [Candidatus Peribacteraceae bacterium]
MKADFSLEGTRVFLRVLTEADASQEYVQWLNDPVVNRYLETRSATTEKVKEFIREKNESEDALLLGIFWKESGVHIGTIKLEPIARDKGEATLGILIGNREYWGKGAATEATNLMTGYALSELGLREITLGVIPENEAAIRVYKKCGFTIDHIEKNAVNHDGLLYDRIVMHKTSCPPAPSAA